MEVNQNYNFRNSIPVRSKMRGTIERRKLQMTPGKRSLYREIQIQLRLTKLLTLYTNI